MRFTQMRFSLTNLEMIKKTKRLKKIARKMGSTKKLYETFCFHVA